MGKCTAYSYWTSRYYLGLIETGNIDNTGDCFAQLLANELKTTVEAPTDILWVNFDGTYYVGKKGSGQMKLFYSRV